MVVIDQASPYSGKCGAVSSVGSQGLVGLNKAGAVSDFRPPLAALFLTCSCSLHIHSMLAEMVVLCRRSPH